MAEKRPSRLRPVTDPLVVNPNREKRSISPASPCQRREFCKRLLELGVQLFDRSRGQVPLTEAGAVLLGYANQAQSLFAQAESELGFLKGEASGVLALGASTTIAQYALRRRLGEFHAKNPRIEIQMISGNTEQIVAALLEHRIALGLIEGPSRSSEVHIEPYLTDELLLIVPNGHEWAECKVIDAKDLVSTPLLMRERGSGSFRRRWRLRQDSFSD